MALEDVASASKVAGAITIRSILFWVFITASILMIFLGAITDSIQQRSSAPIVSKLGNSFVLVTLQLRDESQKVIETQYDFASDGLFSTIWNVIKSLWRLLFTFMVIYYWLKLLAWIMRATLGNATQPVLNWTLAIFLFTVLQMVAILIFASTQGQIKTSADGIGYIMTPMACYIVFFKALLHLISTFEGKIQAVHPLKTDLNISNINKS